MSAPNDDTRMEWESNKETPISVSDGKSSTDWESHRETITSLYLDGKTNKDILQYLRDHGVRATKNQCERYLRKWKVRKNLTGGEWKLVSRMLGRRSMQGKQSDVLFYGRLLPPLKVRKETRRYDLPKGLRSPSPALVPHIRLCTPPMSTATSSGDGQIVCRNIQDKQMIVTDELPSIELLRYLDTQGQKPSSRFVRS